MEKYVVCQIYSSTPVFRRIMTGIRRYALEHPGFTPLRVENLAPEVLRSRRCGGLITTDAGPVAGKGYAVVLVSNRLELRGVRKVVTDDVAVGRLAARHLIGRGFRELWQVSEEGAYFSKLRWEGFLSECRACGVEPERLMLRWGRYSDPLEYPTKQRGKLGRLLRRVKAGEAIFADNDAIGGMVWEVLGSRGLRVPEDVAIVGVDNLVQSGDMERELSSVELPCEQIGYRAAEIIHGTMRGGKLPERDVLLPPVGVVARQSTVLLKVADLLVRRGLELIGKDERMELTAGEIARALGVDRKTLYSRFRGAIGRTVKEELMRVRMDRAGRLLRETSLGVGEVAMRCGYGKQSTFAASFRKATGLTAGEYRRAHLR